MIKKTFIIKLICLILWAIVILYFSIKPVVIDKTVKVSNISGLEHIAAYFVFAFLLFLILKDYKIKHAIIATIIISFIYGFGMEIIQILLPWRNFSFFDSLLNVVGAALVIITKPLA